MTKKEKYITRRCYIIVVVVVVRDAHNLKPALYFDFDSKIYRERGNRLFYRFYRDFFL